MHNLQRIITATILLSAILCDSIGVCGAFEVPTPPAETDSPQPIQPTYDDTTSQPTDPIPTDAVNPQRPIRQAQFLTLLVSAYECLAPSDDSNAAAQMAIDTSRISSKLTTDKTLCAALELGLLDTLDVSWVQLQMDRSTAANRALNWLNSVRERIYGTATNSATVGDALDELGWALYIVGRIRYVSQLEPLVMTCDNCPEYQLDTPLTRGIYADILVRAYEALYGEISTARLLSAPTDTDSESVMRAIAAGFMDWYKASSSFEPERVLLLCELREPIIRMIRTDTTLGAAALPLEQAQWMVSELLMSFTGVKPDTSPATVLTIDRDWNWYVNQLATGADRGNNCMPACGEMLLNFMDAHNTITTPMLRALSPHDGEGWYDVELLDTLSVYGIELESEFDTTTANMIRDLNAGKLIVAMVNYDGASSGHAVVVMGYVKRCSGVWFMVNDPYSTATNKYGQPEGYHALRESHALIAAMQRHVSRYFTVQTDVSPSECIYSGFKCTDMAEPDATPDSDVG